MSNEQIIQALVQLNDKIKLLDEDRRMYLLGRAKVENPWFTPENVQLAWQGIQSFLDENKLRDWLNQYPQSSQTPRQIGVVMAGNIPMVGFHDLLCVLAGGHNLMAKFSSQDSILMQQMVNWLIEIEPAMATKIQVVDKINAAEAYIATGSDNSARYFEYYFAKKPHIIRRNRNSCAVLSGNESAEDLSNLGKDIFRYFGLGCRSVSKLYVPKNYDFQAFTQAIEGWKEIINHHKYANNYEYNRAIYLVNQIIYYDNGFLLFKPDKALASPIGVLHYETYYDEAELNLKLVEWTDKIQVIATNLTNLPNAVPFGQTQHPGLNDYADGVDTMAFLKGLD
jgi:hypothetical protein